MASGGIGLRIIFLAVVLVAFSLLARSIAGMIGAELRYPVWGRGRYWPANLMRNSCAHIMNVLF